MTDTLYGAMMRFFASLPLDGTAQYQAGSSLPESMYHNMALANIRSAISAGAASGLLDGGGLEALDVTHSGGLLLPTPGGPYVKSANLVLHWAFDEASGTAITDTSASAIAGTAGASTSIVAGKYGNARLFVPSGSSAAGAVVSNTSSNAALNFADAVSFSVSTWINPGASGGAGTTNGGEIISNGDSSYNGWGMRLSYGTTPTVTFINPSSNVVSTGHLTVGQWNHAVVTLNRTGGVVKIYLNGTLDTTQTVAGLANGGGSLQANGTVFAIGNLADWWNNPLDGAVDDVQIYNTLLSQTDVTNLYNGIAPSATYTSGTFTVGSAPTIARIVVLETDVDALTVNADLVCSVSRDGGTTWTAVTMTKQAISGNDYLWYGSLTFSSQPSGTSMQYKLNAPNGKTGTIHGAVLLCG
jgi:Concanavalin A-like lectin/glucanases superfamily